MHELEEIIDLRISIKTQEDMHDTLMDDLNEERRRRPEDRDKELEQKIIHVIRQIDKEKAAAVQQINQIIERLQRMPDEHYRDLLENHYVHGKSWESIAEFQGVSLRYIYKLRQKAIQAFNDCQ